MDPIVAPVSTPPCMPGQALSARARFVYDLGGGGGFCRIVAGPVLVLAVVQDHGMWSGVWCAMVALGGGTCGWIGMGEL